MPTTYKGLSIPTPGTESGTWGNDLNSNTITPIDFMLGGVASIPLSSSNYIVGTNASSEIQCVFLKLTGNILANITVRTSNQGFFVIENNTSGSFSITIQGNYGSGDIGSGIVIGQGSRNFFVSDSTVGVRRADTTLFPSGTVLPFYQASAPVGWTQNTSFNDYAMRIISGSGGVSHAGVGFFGGTTDGHKLVLSEIPSHSHGVTDPGHSHNDLSGQGSVRIPGANFSVSTGLNNSSGSTSIDGTGISIQFTGGDGYHSHFLAGLSMLDFILCSKN